MINWMTRYVKEHKFLDDENSDISGMERRFFENFTDDALGYASRYYIPYDLMGVTTEFCVKGVTLFHDGDYFAIELHHGQGTMVVCYLLNDEEVSKIENAVTFEDIRKNKKHEKYDYFKILSCAKRIRRMANVLELTDDELEKVFELVNIQRKC